MTDEFSILIHSAPPSATTGYGMHTRGLVERMRGDFNIAGVHSVGDMGGTIDWEGIPVYPSGAGKWGQHSIPYWFRKSEASVVFSHHDHWSMHDGLKNAQQQGVPMILYTILDHDLPGEKPPEKVIQANEDAYKTVVMSEWAESRIHNSRIDDDQIHRVPHAFDTKKFAPVTEDIPEGDLKDALGVPGDAFVYGMVAANYGPRKNLPQHMEAFSRVMDEHDDAYMYIHTTPELNGGFNLNAVRVGLGIPEERLIFPDAHEKLHGMDELTMVQLYNTFDVLINCTQAESWGMTVTEAMSCGTPVITTNGSAMTEQHGVSYDTFVTHEEGVRETPHGALVHRGSDVWTQNAVARRFSPYVDHIEEAMRWAYGNRGSLPEKGATAREFVVENYDWDVVWEEYWKPFFEEVEEDLNSGVFNEFYFDRRERETQSEAFGNEYVEVAMKARGDSILDVGAGTGALGELLESDTDGWDVTCVCYSDEAVERCEDRGLETYKGDVRDLQFKDNSFDTAVTQHVLEHVEEDVQALAELARVASERVVCLVPGVTAGGTEADPTEVRRYSPKELERLKKNFEEYTDYEMEWAKTTISENPAVYRIIVDIDEDEE